MLLPKSSYPLPLLFPQVHSLQLPLFNSDSDSDNEVIQSCPTLCDPVDCSLPGSSLHGILQARILERDVGILTADSHCYTAETNATL